jgi:hypothetical protein
MQNLSKLFAKKSKICDYNIGPRLLSLVGLDFYNCVSALVTCNTPMLQQLDLSYVSGLNDGALYKILSAPKDSRPGTFSPAVYLPL